MKEGLTDGNVGTTLVNDTRGSLGSDSAEALADTGEVGLVTAGLAGDGLVEARNGALGDVGKRLSLSGNSGESNESDGVLHFECVFVCFFVLVG
ncbi:unnamed protein product [Fusarium graminearum]|nr:unnamed protein product [Fusarium graminearum]VTO84092.1 unnamed protein product [Fusarium graminearum]